MNIELREAKQYTGAYRGVRFMISHHGIGETYKPDGSWCFYLYVNEGQLIDEYKNDFILTPAFDKRNHLSHPYCSTKIADIEWHSGITFYSKESGVDGEPVIVKMGCDYSHLWDEGKYYDETIILHHIKSAIDSMHCLYPEIKIYSNLYGGYFNESEGEYSEAGIFVSFEEKKKLEADNIERKLQSNPDT